MFGSIVRRTIELMRWCIVLPFFRPTTSYLLPQLIRNPRVSSTGYTVTRGVSAIHHPGCWLWCGRKASTIRKFTCFPLKTGNLPRTCIAKM